VGITLILSTDIYLALGTVPRSGVWQNSRYNWAYMAGSTFKENQDWCRRFLFKQFA